MQILCASTRKGTVSIRFGTTDIRDLSEGQLPATIRIVMVREETGEKKTQFHARVRTERQKQKRAREAAQGYALGWTKHVEIHADIPSSPTRE